MEAFSRPRFIFRTLPTIESLQIEDYINEKNEDLWKELSHIYQIELVYDPNEWSWRINSDDLLVKKIITPTKRIETSSFTHELLHLYIDNLGMSTPKEMLHSIYGDLLKPSLF